MFSHLSKRFTMIFALSLIALLLGGCSGTDNPADPGGGNNGGNNGGTGEFAVELLTTGLGINDVWGTAADKMVAVGERGLIWNYDGTEWAPVKSPTGASLRKVFGFAADDIWAGGSSGTMLHYDGSEWTSVTLPVPTTVTAIWGAAPDDLWVGGGAGSLQHFDGTTWTVVDSGTTRNITSIVGASATEIWAGCSFGTLLTYNGTAWSAEKITVNGTETNNHIYSIWYAADTQTLYATGYSYYLITRQPSGDWLKSLVAGTTSMNQIWGRTSTDYYLTDWGGTVHHYDGTRYFSSTVFSGTALTGIWGVPTGETFAVGLQGGAFHSNSGSQSWDIDMRGNGARIAALWGTAGDNLELIADGGNAYHYNGSSFQNYNVTVNSSYYDMWGSEGVSPIAVGWGGITQLVGTTWSPVWSGMANAYYGIGGYGTEVAVAVGANGAIEARNSSGWVSLAAAGGVHLRGVWAADADNVFVVGDGGVVHNLGVINWNAPSETSGRTTWGSAETGVTSKLTEIWGSSATDIFIVGDEGKILHFDGTDFTSSLGLGSGEFRAIWGSSADNIWAVGTAGMAYHFDGDAWTKFESGVSLTINDVYGFGEDEVYFVMDRGTVIRVGLIPSS